MPDPENAKGRRKTQKPSADRKFPVQFRFKTLVKPSNHFQAPGSRIPPFRAAAATDDLYKPCACLHPLYATTRPSNARAISVCSRPALLAASISSLCVLIRQPMSGGCAFPRADVPPPGWRTVGHSHATCVRAGERPSSTRWTGVVSPCVPRTIRVGYRVPSAQGPETTRHEAGLHPITGSYHAAGIVFYASLNARLF